MKEFVDFNNYPSGEVLSPEEIDQKAVDNYINNLEKQLADINNKITKLAKEKDIIIAKLYEWQ